MIIRLLERKSPETLSFLQSATLSNNPLRATEAIPRAAPRHNSVEQIENWYPCRSSLRIRAGATAFFQLIM